MLWQLGFTMWCQLVFGLMKYVPTNVFFRVLSIIFTIWGQLSTWVNGTHFTPSEFHNVILTKFIFWSIQLFFLCESFFLRKEWVPSGFCKFHHLNFTMSDNWVYNCKYNFLCFVNWVSHCEVNQVLDSLKTELICLFVEMVIRI